MVEVAHRSVTSYDFQRRWQAIVTELFGLADTAVREEPRFTGAAAKWRLGELDLTSVCCSSEFVERRTKHVQADQREKIILVSVRKGHLRLRQRGRDAKLLPRSIVLYSSNVPFTWEHDDLTHVHNIAFPDELLRFRFRNLDGLLCLPFQANIGPWKIVSDFLGSLAEQTDSLPETAGGSYASQLIDLVSTALDCDSPNRLPETNSVRAAIRHRSEAYIRAHMGDYNLDPKRIAAAMGISVRYLHRLFEDSNVSLCEYLLQRRLEAALADLRDPMKADLPVAEIAQRWGFRSHSSFSRSFRAHYGMSATASRADADG